MTEIQSKYNDWIKDFAYHLIEDYGVYYKLIDHLHSVAFEAIISYDENRASDGKDLRMRFVEQDSEYTYRDVYLYLDAPVSMLEVLLGLAVRCEENIMANPDMGDRTGLWFYTMLETSGLAYQDDYRFDIYRCDHIIENILNRNYEADGSGGLFCVPNSKVDMRTIEIWRQMHMYINYKYPLFD